MIISVNKATRIIKIVIGKKIAASIFNPSCAFLSLSMNPTKWTASCFASFKIIAPIVSAAAKEEYF